MKKTIFKQSHLVYILLLITFYFVAGCYSDSNHNNWETVKLEASKVEFNQALLRECIPYLSSHTGIKVELSEELNKVNDLYVDFRPDPKKKYSLKDILLAIKAFVQKEHNVNIVIKPINDNYVLLQLNTEK